MTSIKTKEDFEAVFRTHYNMLCNTVVSIVSDRSRAEDVVQEVMVHLWSNRKKIAEVQHLRAFLIQSCRNKAIEILRKEASVKRRESEISDTPTVEDINVDQAWLKEQIFDSIRHLPSKCGQVFIMSKVEGLTYTEIAESLDISVKTVENHMGKAFKLLRKMLAGKIYQ
jgi:RNA polymerase sigma-70 factor (ECF subfamily)